MEDLINSAKFQSQQQPDSNPAMKLPNTVQPPEFDTLDRYVKVTEAAGILGFNSCKSVEDLISRNTLPCYNIPDNKIKRVLLSDLYSLINNKQKHNGTSPEDSTEVIEMPPKTRGRPRKYSD